MLQEIEADTGLLLENCFLTEIDQWATNNTGIMIDGAVTQFGLKVMGRVVLPNNTTGCHSMLHYHYQVMSNEQNGTNQMSFLVHSSYDQHILIMIINFTCAM